MEQAHIDFHPEPNQSLTRWLEEREDFMATLQLIKAFQAYPILAPVQIFTVEANGQHVLPVFTTQADWEVFMAKLQGNKNMSWNLISFFQLVDFVQNEGLPVDAFGFNLKTKSDALTSNFAYLSKDEVEKFVVMGLQLLIVTGETNQESDAHVRFYLVPVFQEPDASGTIRREFSTLKASDGATYIPVFDSMTHLENWFQSPGFGAKFRENKGLVIAMKIEDIQQPKNAIHVLRGITGVSVNALTYENNLISFKKPRTLDDLRKLNQS